MHGDVAYCLKHGGHEWKTIDAGIDEMPWIKTKCMRCGITLMTFRLFDEEGEE